HSEICGKAHDWRGTIEVAGDNEHADLAGGGRGEIETWAVGKTAAAGDVSRTENRAAVRYIAVVEVGGKSAGVHRSDGTKQEGRKCEYPWRVRSECVHNFPGNVSIAVQGIRRKNGTYYPRLACRLRR